MCTKNHAQYLNNCISKILNQTFQDYVFFIYNDESKDDTAKILNFWANKDSRIVIVKKVLRGNLLEKAHSLFLLSKSKYVWFIASDDFVHDQRFLECGFSYMDSEPKLGGFFCNTRQICAETGKWEGNWGWHGPTRILRPNKTILEFLKNGLIIPGSSCIVKRDCFIQAGCYRKKAGALCDLLSCIEIAARKGLFFTGRCSVSFRIFKNRKSFGNKTPLNEKFANWAFFEHTLQPFGFHKESAQLNHWRLKILCNYMPEGRKRSLAAFDYGLRLIRVYNNNLSLFKLNGIPPNFYIKNLIHLKYPTAFERFLLRLKRSIRKRIDRFRMR